MSPHFALCSASACIVHPTHAPQSCPSRRGVCQRGWNDLFNSHSLTLSLLRPPNLTQRLSLATILKHMELQICSSHLEPQKVKTGCLPPICFTFSIRLSIQLSFYPPIIHLCIYVHTCMYVCIISIYIFHEVVISQSCCCMRFVMLFYFICTCAFVCMVV